MGVPAMKPQTTQNIHPSTQCQSGCVGLVYNVEKLFHLGLRLYAPRRGKVNRRTIADFRLGRLNLQSPSRACKYSYFAIVKLG